MQSYTLLIFHHNGTEETRELPQGTLGIGRARENWLCPLDTTLSRRHSLLRVESESVWIEGLPSRNGTLVNGERIEKARQLEVGDEVAVGRTIIRLNSLVGGSEERRRQPTVELATGAGRDDGKIVAVSEEMVRLVRTCERFAKSSLPVLITGESGTGKELIAQSLHQSSSRRDGPLVVLNCPALAEGLMGSELFGVEAGVATGVKQRCGRLEQASGGTLFLDEVADLSAEAQAMLLRFLQNGTIERVGGRSHISVDVRVVAATNSDLEAAIQEGRFRSDLFFRISALRLDIPPLRDRADDIIPLAEWFLQQTTQPGLQLSNDARSALLSYGFPGNVRELAAFIERAALLAEGDQITATDLGLRATDDLIHSVPDGVPGAVALLEDVVSGERDFWESVYQPYLARELPRSTVSEIVALGFERSGGSVKALAELLRVKGQYRKLLDFLRNHRIAPS